jgi:hypothetical protein
LKESESLVLVDFTTTEKANVAVNLPTEANEATPTISFPFKIAKLLAQVKTSFLLLKSFPNYIYTEHKIKPWHFGLSTNENPLSFLLVW